MPSLCTLLNAKLYVLKPRQTLNRCRPPPESHRPALDLRGRGDLEELVEATGRPYRTYNYYAPTESPPFDVSAPAAAATGDLSLGNSVWNSFAAAAQTHTRLRNADADAGRLFCRLVAALFTDCSSL